ncbi:unknown [Clostridium sp. CAG:417]|jgi:DNA-directed RNA polymerase sigma subunit (sigma70/sigma32)|nr:unknown [Clostridium sp. CAG:417]
MLAESNLRLVVSIAKHNTRIDYIGHIADTLGVSLEQLFAEILRSFV